MNKTISFLACWLVSLLGFSQTTKECLDLSYDQELANTLAFEPLENYEVFFLGETHNVGSNDLMDYSLLTHLNKTQKVNYFIREGTYSYNFILSKYIKTGDTYYLSLLGDDFSVIEERVFLEKLVTYNKTISESERIKLYGIDSEPFYHLPAMLVALQYNREPPPKPVSDVFEMLGSFKTDKWSYSLSKKDKAQIKKIWESVSPIIIQNEKVFQDYLHDDFIHLKMVINNAATLKRSDKQLFQNFIKLQELTKAEKFYFSYGSLHAQKGGSWLAGEINNSSKFKNKVFSIKTIYHNSTFLWGKENLPLNTLDKNKEEESKMILSVFDECSCDFAFLSTDGLTFAKDFDLLMLCRKQHGITLIKNK